MDETTKQALNDFVQRMLAAAEQGASWSAGQAPLVVQEWLRWQLVSNIGLAVLAGLVVCVCVFLVIRLSDDVYFDEMIMPLTLAIVVAVCAGGIFTLRAAKVVIAPRVVIIEKFSELVR